MITVYSKPHCSQCDATKRLLDQHDVEYTVKDITLDAEALDRVIELGYQQAPVVEVDTDSYKDAWSGYEPTKIAKFVMQR